MVTLKLISNTGITQAIQVKTDWQDITVAEYFEMQGKTDAEVITMLTGIDAAAQTALDEHTALYLAELLSGFQVLPEGDYDLNIEYETIGQLETARSFMRRLSKEYPDNYRLHILPYLYGLYKAERVNGQWHNKSCMDLAEQAKGLPVAEVLPFAKHILSEIDRVNEADRKLNTEEADPDAVDAGIEELDKFGFYPVLNALTNGDILKQEEVLQLTVVKVRTHLQFLKTTAEIQKNLQTLKKEAV